MKALAIALLLAATFLLGKPADAPTVPYAASERLCKAYAVYMEARGESLRGQRAVLDVIHNRMWDRKLSACGVVKQRKQFSFYNVRKQMELARKDLTHFLVVATMPPVAGKSTFYHERRVHPVWARAMKREAAIGSHIFYTTKE
jgi:N-acetylmuramoyl-L-alanine amidase